MDFKILQIILLLIFTFCCTFSKMQGQSIVGGEISCNYSETYSDYKPFNTLSSTFYIGNLIGGLGFKENDNNCPRLGEQTMIYPINEHPLALNTVTASPDTSICVGDSAQLNAIGLGPNPMYQWTPSAGLSNPTIPNPKASPTSTRTYTVIVGYSDGTTSSDQVTVTVNTRPTVVIGSQIDARCLNVNDGIATALATGTTGSYSYQWDVNTGNQAGNTAINLGIGAYQVLAEDLNNCTDSTIVNIGAILTPKANVASIINVLCYGDSTGSIMINGTGGTGQYDYLWNAAANNQITATAINLKANINYEVHVTDTSGCLDTLISLSLTQPVAPLSVSAAVTSNYNGANISCFGAVDGVAEAFVSGGTSGYNILWNTGVSADSVIGGAGRYYVKVTDANLCEAGDSVDLVAPLILNANVININSSTCAGGTATGEGVGGTGGYSYAWNDGQLTAIAVGLQVANNPYIVSVMDANGCLATNTFSVNPSSGFPGTPDIQAADTSVCIGDSINLTTITTGSIRYYWSGPNGFISNVQSPTILGARLVHDGFYYLSIEDTLTGCFSADTVLYIEVNDPPNPPFIIGGGIVCEGTTIHIEDQIGAANCALEWLGPVIAQTGTAFSVDVNVGMPNYQAGLWRLEYTDTITGCTAISNPVFVDIVPTPPPPNPVVHGSVCVGGSVNLSVPMVLGATVNWYSNPSQIGGVLYTGHTITIPGITTDTLFYAEYVTPNCTSSLGLVNIVVAPNPATPTISPDLVICEGNDIILNTTTDGDTFHWSHPNHILPNQQNIVISPSVLSDSGLYTLSVVDTNGCTSPDAFVYVTINNNPIAPLAETNAPICDGETVQLYHSGACVQSIWLAPTGAMISSTTDTLTLLSTDPNYERGNWRFICQDFLGCTDTSNVVNVRIKHSPPVPTPFNNSFICIGKSVRLGVPLVNGASYNWYSDSLLSIPTIPGTGANPIVPNITMDSTFYVEVTVGNCSSVGQTYVEVFPSFPKPEIPADFDVCEGDTLKLTTPTNASSYRWTLPFGGRVNNRILLIPSVALPIHNGMYTLSIRDVNDCPVPDTTVVITINPRPNPPSVSSEVICSGEPLVLIAVGTCDSIEWTGPFGGSFVAGDTLVILPGTLNYIDGGNWTTSCLDVATNCQSLATNYQAQIRPTPAKQLFIIMTPFVLANPCC